MNACAESERVKEKVMSQAWRNTTEWEGDQACWPLCVSFLSIISQTDSSHNCFNRWSPGRRPSTFLHWSWYQKTFSWMCNIYFILTWHSMWIR